ncbi:MAG: domain S-box/diguanylate cyclase protein [Panacagrimonas sp.]|nr:domain S-box/diguanylate cyclase protein [Panacagrimonas sp.]
MVTFVPVGALSFPAAARGAGAAGTIRRNACAGNRRGADRYAIGGGVNPRIWLHEVREAWSTKRGRALVVWVLFGLIVLQGAVLLPALVFVRDEYVMSAVREETSRVHALLQGAGRQAVLDDFRQRPLMLGLMLRDATGRNAGVAGFTEFGLDRLAGPGRHFVFGDGVIDTAFDVEREDGTWRVYLRCHTGPVTADATRRVLGLAAFGLLGVLVGGHLMILLLRRKVVLPLEQQARHDPLTGLPNRTHFDHRLNEVIERCQDSGTAAALLFIDLDRFKDFNDNFGHPQGDALLVEISRRLRHAIPGDCIAGRLGGDEFAVVLSSIQKVSEARYQAEQILDLLSRPYRYNQFHFQLSASIGVAMLPEHGTTPADAQRNADIAMFVSKRAGRARVTMFDGAMSAAVSRRKEVEDRLRVAIERDELTVQYQPKMSVDGNRVEGAEALLRWTLPDGRTISPAEFIPVAEESGLIVPLGRWVLRRVLWQIANWVESGFRPPRVSVNISANQFLDEDFLDSFLRVLDRSGVPAGYLDLEITESALITTPDHAVSVLQTLRQRGITVSLDDFGTGYSSLGYLKRFPVNSIKIDRSFVVDLAENPESALLVKAVIGMTHSLGLLFVAEGVETEEQLRLLRQWNCDQYQGHLTSPSIEAEAFREFCAAHADPERPALARAS